MTNIVSFVILGLLIYGRNLAKTSRRLHAYWMSAVIFADVSLILYLVVAREALSKVEPQMPGRLMIHLFFALSTVVLYGVAVSVGLRRLKGQKTKWTMKQLDRFIIPARILTLATSLWLYFAKN